MLRLWAVVLGMEIAAILVGVLAFGWLVLLVGVPLLLVTALVVAAVRLSEHTRERQRRRAAEQAARDAERTALLEQRGLMSGFFEMPTQANPVEDRGPVRS